jgi:gluconate transporter
MPANGPTLLFLTFGAIGLLLFLILYVRLHAFLGLMICAMALGLSGGMAPATVLKSIQSGFGEALGFIAVVVGLGAMIGRYLEYSGGGQALADWLLEKFGKDRAAWAVLVAAYLVGLPIFFEVGFIILVPLVWDLAKESKRSLLYYGLPMAGALTVLHSMVPPHPAPAAAAQMFGADLGKTMLYGAVISVPMILAGGMFYGTWIAKRIHLPVPEMAAREVQSTNGSTPPSVPLVILILLLPVLLIFTATLWPQFAVFKFLGHPFSALMVTTLAAMIFFGVSRGLGRDQLTKLATESLAPVGTLLLIMGGGGAFKQIIVDSGAGTYAGKLLASSNISPLLVAYIVAGVMRAAQGSATVAIITAAGIVAPLVKGLQGYSPEAYVLALCSGGTLLSHVNDAGFWIVNQYFGMTVPQTLRTWTAMKVITSLTGIAIILLIGKYI